MARSDIDMEALESLLDETMANSSRYRAKMVAAVVRRLHELLPLTRREASDVCLWAWLGWIRFPHFVAWRWQGRPVGARRSAARFVGDRVRQCSARLWWAAELTVGPDGDYEPTE